MKILNAYDEKDVREMWAALNRQEVAMRSMMVLKKQALGDRYNSSSGDMGSIGYFIDYQERELLELEGYTNMDQDLFEPPKGLKPIILPPYEDDKIPPAAYAAVITTIPKGKVATINQILDIVAEAYGDDYHVSWPEYYDSLGEISVWGLGFAYTLHEHRVVDNNGEILGLGGRYGRARPEQAQADANDLYREGVPYVKQKNNRYYVKDLEKHLFDFSDVLIMKAPGYRPYLDEHD